MKKIKYLLATLLMFTLVLTGCGDKKEEIKNNEKANSNEVATEELVDKIVDSYTNVENYKVNVDLGFKATVEDETLDISVVIDGTVDQKNKVGKVTLSVNAMEEKIATEMYLAYNDTTKEITIYVKNPETNEWIKTSQSMEGMDMTVSEDYNKQLKDMLNTIFGNDKLKQIEADENNYNYEAVITGEEIQTYLKLFLNELLGSLKTEETNSENNTNAYEQLIKLFQGDITFNLSVNKENSYISKLKVDIKDFANKTINNILKLSDSETTMDIARADAKIEFTDFNKVGTIVIPTEALNGTEVSSVLNTENLLNLN